MNCKLNLTGNPSPSNFSLSFKLRSTPPPFLTLMQPQRDLVLMSAALSLIGHAPLSCKVWTAFSQKAGNSTNLSESHPHKLQAALWKRVSLGSSQALSTCSRRESHTKGLRPQQVRGACRGRRVPTFPISRFRLCVQTTNPLRRAAPLVCLCKQRDLLLGNSKWPSPTNKSIPFRCGQMR